MVQDAGREIYILSKSQPQVHSLALATLTSISLCRKEKMRVTLAFLIVVATTTYQGVKETTCKNDAVKITMTQRRRNILKN